MPLSTSEIARHLGETPMAELAKPPRPRTLTEKDRFAIAPTPDVEAVRMQGSASIDLRLGTWFVTTKASRHSLLDIYIDPKGQPTEHNITDRHYVPLGRHFILHPHSFVLAATLEWLRMPRSMCGYVTGKSSWGRRGLIIETAPGVHPGFVGCLTLELANVGELPIKLVTGTKLCQLFLHRLHGDTTHVDQSAFLGQRQPRLGRIEPDTFVRKLMATHSEENRKST